jgi:hypothetical protein
MSRSSSIADSSLTDSNSDMITPSGYGLPGILNLGFVEKIKREKEFLLLSVWGFDH